MTHIELTNWFKELNTYLVASRQRKIVAISESSAYFDMCVEVSQQVINQTEKKQFIHYANNSLLPSVNVNHLNAKHLLGSETGLLIFDASGEFHIDDLIALSGTVVAGGIILLFLPNLVSDDFVHYFYASLKQSNGHYVLNESAPLPTISDNFDSFEELTTPVAHEHCATRDQEVVVEDILRVLSGHRKRPLVITADRGRGKSSALAIAVADILLRSAPKHIVVTAPQPQSLSIFFNRLKHCIPDGILSKTQFQYQQSTVTFYPVDQLVKDPVTTDLLLVDEAAGIPVSCLSVLLTHYHRAVFSSTVHGYEGAGRGFSLKFDRILNKQCPGWRGLLMEQPIRWQQFDATEQFFMQYLFLGVDIPKVTYLPSKSLEFKVLNKKELLASKALMANVFSLLVTAHYQTKPSDLKMLLTNPQLQILVAQQSNNIICVALLMREGMIEQDLVAAIASNQRRIKGHLLPQSICTHLLQPCAFDFSYLRIMRIAVHPEVQSQGIGSKMLAYCQDFAHSESVDILGATFGTQAPLLKFWQNNNFNTIRMGFAKDAASGEYSAMVVMPTNARAADFISQLTAQFERQFPYWLGEEYSQISTELIWQLSLEFSSVSSINFTEFELAQVNAFVDGKLQYSPAAPALWHWCILYLKNIPQDKIPHVLMQRCLQKHTWKSLSEQQGLPGKKAILSHIKNELKLAMSAIQRSLSMTNIDTSDKN